MSEMNAVTRRGYERLIAQSPWMPSCALAEDIRDLVERGIEETAFTKIVETARGEALLIDGELVEIISSRPAFHVEVISRALRRGGADRSQGSDSSQPNNQHQQGQPPETKTEG